jgi:hypothetical protein
MIREQQEAKLNDWGRVDFDTTRDSDAPDFLTLQNTKHKQMQMRLLDGASSTIIGQASSANTSPDLPSTNLLHAPNIGSRLSNRTRRATDLMLLL